MSNRDKQVSRHAAWLLSGVALVAAMAPGVALAQDAATAAIPLIYLTALVSPEEAKDLGGQVGGRPGVSKRAPLSELVSRIDQAILR